MDREGGCTGTLVHAKWGAEQAQHTHGPGAYLLHLQKVALAATVNQPHGGTQTHDFYSASNHLSNWVLCSGSLNAKVSSQGLGSRAPISSSPSFFRHPNCATTSQGADQKEMQPFPPSCHSDTRFIWITPNTLESLKYAKNWSSPWVVSSSR